MDWTKIPTDLIVSGTSDLDILSIVKYQLVWALLERRPDDKILSRYLTPKQVQRANAVVSAIEQQVNSDIISINKKRNRQKIYYEKNQSLIKNSDAHTDGHNDGRSDAVDKIREDKIRYKYKGAIIKLNEKDYNNWQERFDLLDLKYELDKRDIWLASQSNNKNWFISTQQYLLTVQRKKEKEKETQDKISQPWWRE